MSELARLKESAVEPDGDPEEAGKTGRLGGLQDDSLFRGVQQGLVVRAAGQLICITPFLCERKWSTGDHFDSHFNRGPRHSTYNKVMIIVSLALRTTIVPWDITGLVLTMAL